MGGSTALEQVKVVGAKVLQKMLALLYPYTCPICGKVPKKVNGKYERICPECTGKLHYIHSPRCLVCGKPVDSYETELCFDCSRREHLFTQGTGVWTYTDEIKNSIYDFKYHNRRINRYFYAEEIIRNCGNVMRNWNADALIPVPLHADRYRKRGYNQAELIAELVGKWMGIPVDAGVLYRTKKTVPQKELDDRQRNNNVKNAFKMSNNIVKYKKIILIDDIYTTGTTMDACAEALLAAGVEKVYCVSLCIGRGF